MFTNRLKIFSLISVTALLISGCSGGESKETDDTGAVAKNNEVSLIVHDSFTLENFTDLVFQETGLNVNVVTSGGGQELTTTLALTKGDPLADAVFGIDNFFASRLVENDVVVPYLSKNLTARGESFLYDEVGHLTPITLGATCINVDSVWFAERGIEAPKTYADLLKPEYQNLTVLIDPVASSTGASFFVGTVASFGINGAIDYWQELLANGARIESGWSSAYYGQFTGGAEDGTYPIVVSYSSSPAYTVTDDGSASTTAALLDTCSSTVEYAGVLDGAKNPEAAEKLIDFLLSEAFQNLVAEAMYVYPISEKAYIPEPWQEFAPLPENPNDLPAVTVGENREDWLRQIADTLGL